MKHNNKWEWGVDRVELSDTVVEDFIGNPSESEGQEIYIAPQYSSVIYNSFSDQDTGKFVWFQELTEFDKLTKVFQTKFEVDRSQVDPESEDIFNYAVKQWRAETGMLSVFQRRTKHPLYKLIKRMGWGVMPIILRDLNNDPYEWLPILFDITGSDPVSKEDKDDLDRVIAAWRQWGKEMKYIN